MLLASASSSEQPRRLHHGSNAQLRHTAKPRLCRFFGLELFSLNTLKLLPSTKIDRRVRDVVRQIAQNRIVFQQVGQRFLIVDVGRRPTN